VIETNSRPPPSRCRFQHYHDPIGNLGQKERPAEATKKEVFSGCNTNITTSPYLDCLRHRPATVDFPGQSIAPSSLLRLSNTALSSICLDIDGILFFRVVHIDLVLVARLSTFSSAAGRPRPTADIKFLLCTYQLSKLHLQLPSPRSSDALMKAPKATA
jgi:hypothetical protein